MDVNAMSAKRFKPADANEKVGRLFQSSPQVIKTILNTFSYFELTKLMLVCKTWQNYAVKLTNEKYEVEHFLALNKSKRKTDWKCLGDMCDVKLFRTQELSIRTRHMIVFAKLSASSYELNKTSMRSKLPGDVCILAIKAPGIIGTDRSTNIAREYENCSRPCFSGLHIPNINGVDVHWFKLSHESFKESGGVVDQTFINCISGLNPLEQVKCVIIVSDDSFLMIGGEIIMAFKNREGGSNTVVCGGVAENVSVLLPNEKEMVETGLIGFCLGGDNINVWSIVIGEETKNEKEVQISMAKLKSMVQPDKPPKQLFAFMFTCIARGKKLYKKENVETKEFQKHFAQVPIIGMFSLGEYASEHSFADGSADPDKYILAYSTVITVVAVL